MHTSAELYAEWTRKLAEVLPAFAKTVFNPNAERGNPSRSYGGVLKDYANALADMNRKVKHLRQDMHFAETEAGRLHGNLEASTREVEAAASVLNSTYSRLPETLRHAHDGKAVPDFDANQETSLARTVNPAIFGRWRTKYGGTPLQLSQQGEQVVVVITFSKESQTFSGRAVVDSDGNLGPMTFRAITPGTYSWCETQKITESDLDLGCHDPRDSTYSSDLTAIR
jgi:hypothetical protein